MFRLQLLTSQLPHHCYLSSSKVLITGHVADMCSKGDGTSALCPSGSSTTCPILSAGSPCKSRGKNDPTIIIPLLCYSNDAAARDKNFYLLQTFAKALSITPGRHSLRQYALLTRTRRMAPAQPSLLISTAHLEVSYFWTEVRFRHINFCYTAFSVLTAV